MKHVPGKVCPLDEDCDAVRCQFARAKAEQNRNMMTAGNRFTPDWEHTWTKEEAEEELAPLVFNGPGWYLWNRSPGKLDTLLVLPDSIPDTTENGALYMQLKDTFAHSWPYGTKFRFYCYNGRNPAALFCAIANAPTRLDER